MNLKPSYLPREALNPKPTNFGVIIPTMVVLFNIFLILHPQEMIAAAKEGLQMWFNQVLPALLPFVAGANLLAALGFIHFIGAVMAPIMVPVFKVPGVGAFALLTGFASGYPMGAKAVAHLRETGQIKKEEAQRLIAFTNNAGPLFVVGFIGAGLFGSVRIGYLLLISHIVAAISVGLLIRQFAGADKSTAKGGIRQAFEDYHSFRQSEYKGFGQALGNSIKNAMDSMVLIGGFIIIFCVVIEVLNITLANAFDTGGNSLLAGFAAGFLEVANGVKIIAQSSQQGGALPNPHVPRMTLAAASAIISFGGLSVHSQTAHFIRNTDIKFLPYLAAKGLQASISAAICWVLA